MTATALATIGLCHRFGAMEVTRNVDFTLREGSRHALIGPNGAGKTTFINLLTGTLRPRSGEIRIADQVVTHLPEAERARRGLARAFQLNQLFRGLTVFENVAMAVSQRMGAARQLWSRPVDRSDVIDGTIDVLSELQLGAAMFRRIGDLPYGTQRLVEIAIAVAMRPRILLLDEPGAGVPGHEIKDILGVIANLDPTTAILIIEHNMEIVFQFAREITVLVGGAIFKQGTPDEIAADENVRRVYLGGGAHA